jgi:hypothetical protein
MNVFIAIKLVLGGYEYTPAGAKSESGHELNRPAPNRRF